MQFGLNLTTAICAKCSFVFTNPRPEQNLYQRFYSEAYSEYYGYTAPHPEGIRKERVPEFIRFRLDQIERIRDLNGTRLLDVGPGQGIFLWWAQQRGCSVTGVEPSPDFYETLIQEGFTSFHGSFEDLRADDIGQFEIIAMFHVLEHFYDPNKALDQCRALLVENGLLVIEVPNILKPYRSLDDYFLRYVHLTNFSPYTLNAILDKHGFDILYVNEGGSDWRTPQSLFLIARKRKSLNGGFDFPKQSVDEVFELLRRYRIRWYSLILPAWVMHTSYQRGKNYIRPAARWVKNKFR